MCVGSVFTQPPYNNKNPPSGIFLMPINNIPFSQIKLISDSWLCDVTQTQAPPTIVD